MQRKGGMGKNYILIVEDEWVLYDDLADHLTSIGYSVAPYTKSYPEAMHQISIQQPDMVLLDIDLDGEKDGIDLGEKLSANYQIPFIYLSAFTDKLTLKRARRTQPETFLIKTKPRIDKKQLEVSIQMVLERKLTDTPVVNEMEGILAYTDYYRDAKDRKYDNAFKVLCRFKEILWIETDAKKRNYLVLHSADAQITYYKSSLAQIKPLLPQHFVRINTSQIVNLKNVQGKINHSSFTIGDHVFKIGKNYTDQVHKILHRFYAE